MSKSSKAEFVKWFGPLLDALRDLGDSGKPREVYDRIAKNHHLADSVLDETLKSGTSRFQNQVAWARESLNKSAKKIGSSKTSFAAGGIGQFRPKFSRIYSISA
jgi:hypothetical protein